MKKRSIFTIVLLVVLVELLVTIPLLLLTPGGKHIVSAMMATPIVGTTSPARMVIPTPTPTPRPVLTAISQPPSVQAKAAYLLDADTGRELMAVNAQARLPMASTTKIMTAIIALQRGNLNQEVTVGMDAVNEARPGDSSAGLIVGDKLPLIDLVYGLMLPSGDDAAITIADAISGSPQKFVELMNRYAARLNLKNTHYINANGLTYYQANGKPVPGHYTSAEDLAKLTAYALQNETFAQIVHTQIFKVPFTSNHHAYEWDTTNDLLYTYPGLAGVKTGYTPEAGYCLVFAAEREGHKLIGVLLNDGGTDIHHRFVDAQRLLNWGFSLPMLPPSGSPAIVPTVSAASQTTPHFPFPWSGEKENG